MVCTKTGHVLPLHQIAGSLHMRLAARTREFDRWQSSFAKDSVLQVAGWAQG
jgi:hypothetical protein